MANEHRQKAVAEVWDRLCDSVRKTEPDMTQCRKMKPGLNIIRKSNIFIKKLLLYMYVCTNIYVYIHGYKYALQWDEFL